MKISFRKLFVAFAMVAVILVGMGVSHEASARKASSFDLPGYIPGP